MSKVLCLQFRTDQSELHEQTCIFRHTPEVEIDFVSIHSLNGQKPEQLLSGYSALILGGLGEADICDDSPFMRDIVTKSRPIILYAADKDFPLLGVCFGHQLIAHILGGKVVNDQQHAETGIHDINLNEIAQTDRLFEDLPNTFQAVVGHKDTVIELPKGAVELARNQYAPNHAFRFKQNIYGLQYHGELDEQDLRERLRLYPEYKKNIKQTHYEPTPHAPSVLKRFVAHYCQAKQI